MRHMTALAPVHAFARHPMLLEGTRAAAPEWLRVAVVYGCAAALMFARGHM